MLQSHKTTVRSLKLWCSSTSHWKFHKRHAIPIRWSKTKINDKCILKQNRNTMSTRRPIGIQHSFFKNRSCFRPTISAHNKCRYYKRLRRHSPCFLIVRSLSRGRELQHSSPPFRWSSPHRSSLSARFEYCWGRIIITITYLSFWWNRFDDVHDMWCGTSGFTDTLCVL